MTPIILGRDADEVVISSDHHLAPRLIKNLPSVRTDSLKPPFNWLYSDVLSKPDASVLRIFNGDSFHTHPHFWFERSLVNGAMSHLTDLMVNNDITGENLKVIPGNHTKVENWPSDVVAEWLQRGILVNQGKLQVFDPATKLTFNIQHGHEAQPWTVYPPLADSTIIQRIAEKALTVARKTGIIKPHFYPYADAERALKFINAAQLEYTQENFPDPLSLAIYGHTHVTGFYPEKKFFNTGFRDPIHNWIPEISISKDKIKLRQRSLASSESENNYMRNQMSLSALTELLTNQAGQVLQRELGFVTIRD